MSQLRPIIVCLCGSTRFYQAFMEANYRETMAGKIVLSVGFYPHATAEMHGEGVGASDLQKLALDELHLRKIDLADEVLILNVGGYIGTSTRREIAYARDHNKMLRFLETPPVRYYIGDDTLQVGHSPDGLWHLIGCAERKTFCKEYWRSKLSGIEDAETAPLISMPEFCPGCLAIADDSPCLDVRALKPDEEPCVGCGNPVAGRDYLGRPICGPCSM